MDATPRVDLALPDGWVRVDDGAVVSARSAEGGTGAPAVSVVEVPGRTDPAEHLLEAVRQLLTVLSDPLVVAAEVVDGEPRIVVAHEMLGVDVTTIQRHLRGPGPTALVAAATVSDLLWAAWRSPLERVLASVEVTW